jgi:hypothetical protein
MGMGQGMKAGIRTPAEVIALALEDGGLDVEQARKLSEEAAKRLSVALRSVSSKAATAVVWSPRKGIVEWGYVSET